MYVTSSGDRDKVTSVCRAECLQSLRFVHSFSLWATSTNYKHEKNVMRVLNWRDFVKCSKTQTKIPHQSPFKSSSYNVYIYLSIPGIGEKIIDGNTFLFNLADSNESLFYTETLLGITRWSVLKFRPHEWMNHFGSMT